jgi:neutral ceramidase
LHQPKPILLAIGEAHPPVLPTVLPIGVARVGQLALVIGPAEYTTMSGRRFRQAVQQALPGVKYVVVAGYANDYAGYVATREEYEVQHYEGAATLYGPWTQAAYQQEFARLASDIAAGRASQSHAPPIDVRGTVRPTPLGTAADHAPPEAQFGDVVRNPATESHRGDTVSASFWTGNPQNGYRADRHYAIVERLEGGAWVPVAEDGQWELKLRWKQPPLSPPQPTGVIQTAATSPVADTIRRIDPLGPHQVSVQWTVPADAVPGKYRITHTGVYKDAAGLHEFVGHSSEFAVR